MDKQPGIIIQARLTSKRFPNKVLAEFKKKSIIEWCIEACLKTGLPVTVAIPRTISNQGLETFLKVLRQKKGWKFNIFKGHEEDLLTRYLECASKENYHPIVRVCADSPFIASEDIKLALDIYNKRGYLTRVNHAEVFGFDELEYADSTDPFISSREHVVRSIGHTVDFPEDIKKFYEDFENSPTMKKRWEVCKNDYAKE